MKRISAFIFAALMLLSFSSCASKDKDKTPDSQENTSATPVVNEEKETEIISEVVTDEEGKTEIITEIVEVESTKGDKTTDKQSASDKETTTKKQSASVSKIDPSDWSKEEVVSFYKKACAKSSGAKSTQTMIMRKNSLKAAGGIGTFLGVAEPLIRTVLELNSTEFDGITGGHQKLVASDCKTAKAYKSGNYTVVEMTMVDQTDGIYGKTYEGTVGHAISVVNGVAEAAEQFPALDIRYKEADIKVHYTDAKLKVKINKNGVIEKGTWSYVVTPVVNDLYIENLEVDDAGAIIDYKVTVGGGF